MVAKVGMLIACNVGMEAKVGMRIASNVGMVAKVGMRIASNVGMVAKVGMRIASNVGMSPVRGGVCAVVCHMSMSHTPRAGLLVVDMISSGNQPSKYASTVNCQRNSGYQQLSGEQ